MTTRIKSSQITDGAIVASDLNTAIAISTTQSGTFGSVIVSNYTLGNNRISTTQAGGYNGDIMLDASGNIIFDADGSTISLKDNGLNFGQFYNTSSGDFNIYAPQADKHIKVLGNDNGSTVTALDFDMENAGRATFNENIVLGGSIVHASNLTIDAVGDITLNADGADIVLRDDTVDFGRFKRDAGNFVIKAETADKDIIFKGVKAGSPNTTVTALTLDMSADGDATFNSHVKMNTGNSIGKFAVMSPAVHGSYDFYNNGSSYFNGSVTVDDILTISGSSGVLRGPSTFTIDPATHADNTGTVVIAGNLQVDGTTTTINSTTLTVDDKNITLASGSSNKAAATGAGLTADLGSDGTATFAYDHTQDRWQMNKGLELLSGAALTVGTGTTDVGRLESVSGVLELNAYTGRQIAFGNDTNGEHVRIDADGNVGIGNIDPQARIHVSGTGAPAIRIQDDDGTNNYADMGHNGGTTTFVSRNNTSNGSYIFYGYNGTTFDPLMSLDPAGRLGVNQTPLSNNFALQVTGMQPNGSDARVMYLKGAGTATSIGSTGPTLVLQNTNTTANNIVKLSFESSGAGETVSINAINTNHSSHYGDMAFNTRGSSGYSEKMRIASNGEIRVQNQTLVDSANTNHIMIFPNNKGISIGSAYTYGEFNANNGNVYIRANSYPANTGSESLIYLQTANSSGGQSSDVVVKGGKVGIGNTNPYFPLHVQGPTGFNGEAKNNGLLFDTASATTGTGGGLAFGGYSNGTSGDIYHFANIQGIKENSTAGNYASAMLFSTRAAGATPLEQMRISSTGKVGIGTNNPGYLLHADAIGTTDPSYIVAGSGGNFIMAMGSQNSPGVAQEAFIGTLSNQRFKVKVNNVEKATFTSTGLGIGVTPTVPLQVAGEILATNLSFTNGSGSTSVLGATNSMADLNCGTKGFQIRGDAGFIVKNMANNPRLEAYATRVSLYANAQKKMEVSADGVNTLGPRRQTASNATNVGIYEASMSVTFAPSAAKYFRIQMDGNIAAGLSLHVSGDYGNVNAIGSFEKRYVIGTNASNTGNYGTASTTICDIGPTSSKISLGSTSKPNATTLYIPVVNLDSNYSIVFTFVATLKGEVGGITSIDMIAQ